jgi:hypothetical protein
MLAALKATPKFTVEIGGNTDNVGKLPASLPGKLVAQRPDVSG